ncbi:MAG: aromatic ring-hydroxylating dioxygenase subunit alpha [Rhodospirillaceae bacterium]|nr:aromatic ring-hydroxylating dioxygenase subunit alpha [Rhodospirillaceae bacterium]MYH38445.1 aromatic ring-hydroxylating dioxygenase subunit alpha [Rhodospirillaceae bacterium]MYK15762.1 aromatic ring-hydroxylating dioxygenase subunit alpha [Rhodospirillaceae bacterium]MYK57884.1 aromatic ring-hydroxylating dioxygenase subunit alpha [Rhodospirillaceae bacterium]
MANPAIEPLVANAWYLAAWSMELPDFEPGRQPIARTILNQPLVLFRDAGGTAAALEDRCCHRAAPLRLGQVVNEGLQCGYHGMTFGADGACTVNPGEDPAGHAVRSFPTVERQRMVWIWPGDPARADPSEIVDYPWHDRPDEWPFRYERFELDCNFMLVMDALMDQTHLGYVHAKTIGGAPEFHNAAGQITTRTENGVKIVRHVLDHPPPPTFTKGMAFKGNIDRIAEFDYVAPASVRQFTTAMDVGRGAVENPDQPGTFRFRLFHHATPATETSCHYFWSVANGYRQDDPQAAQDLYDDIYPTFLEDKVVLEAQQQSILRDPDRPLRLRDHDTGVSGAHRALAAFVRRAKGKRPAPAAVAAE